MKKLIALFTGLLFAIGCQNTSIIEKNNNSLFDFDTKSYFKSIQKEYNFNIEGSSDSRIVTKTGACRRESEIWFKGDFTLRDQLLETFQKHVKNELYAIEAKIDGKGGPSHGFDFIYHRPGLNGIIRVNTVIDSKDYIIFDVLIYEQN